MWSNKRTSNLKSNERTQPCFLSLNNHKHPTCQVWSHLNDREKERSVQVRYYKLRMDEVYHLNLKQNFKIFNLYIYT